MKWSKTPFGYCYTPTDDKVQVSKVTGSELKISMPMIPIKLWAALVRFIRWGHAKFDGEVQASGFLNDEGLWRFEALPQETFGMTTKEVENEEREKILQKVRDDGFGDIVFTIHGHCNSSAFQSGTDKSDEFDNKCAGAHITLGKTHEDVMDYDGRVKLVVPHPEGALMPTGKFDIHELVEMPQLPGMEEMPAALVKDIAKHYLLNINTLPPAQFPKCWKARCSDGRKKQTNIVHSHQGWQRMGGYGGTHYYQREFDHGKKSEAPKDLLKKHDENGKWKVTDIHASIRVGEGNGNTPSTTCREYINVLPRDLSVYLLAACAIDDANEKWQVPDLLEAMHTPENRKGITVIEKGLRIKENEFPAVASLYHTIKAKITYNPFITEIRRQILIQLEHPAELVWYGQTIDSYDTEEDQVNAVVDELIDQQMPARCMSYSALLHHDHLVNILWEPLAKHAIKEYAEWNQANNARMLAVDAN